MSKVYLVNFATPEFYDSQKELNKNALKFGVDKTLSYTFERIKKTKFYKENKELLDKKRWVGFGCWKPYIILEALKKIKKGDILIYCDSGISFKADLTEIINRCRKKGIALFESTPLMREWTKRDCFVLMNCDKKEYHNSKQIMAGLNFWKNTSLSKKIVSEWLAFCKDPRIITDSSNQCGLPNFSGFVEHRGDQSILSMLSVKYKDKIDRINERDYSYYDSELGGYNSYLWEVHRRRKRSIKNWLFWKIKSIIPVILKDNIKWFLNNYIKR